MQMTYCPKCDRGLKCTQAHYGKKLKCPNCARVFVLAIDSPGIQTQLSSKKTPAVGLARTVAASAEPIVPLEEPKVSNRPRQRITKGILGLTFILIAPSLVALVYFNFHGDDFRQTLPLLLVLTSPILFLIGVIYCIAGVVKHSGFRAGIAGLSVCGLVALFAFVEFWPWAPRIVACYSRGEFDWVDSDGSHREILIVVELRNSRNSQLADFAIQSPTGETLKPLNNAGDVIWGSTDDRNVKTMAFAVPHSWVKKGGLIVRYGSRVYNVPHPIPERSLK